MAINRYSKAIDQSLEKYVPLPFQEMMMAGAAIQQRGDLAQQQVDQVETGLGSIEAYAPAQKEFISNYVNDFRSKTTSLLDKYQGNTSDPEFIRESKKINMQFASDPRLKIIKEANDKIKFNEQISGKLQAEGKLFIKPEFSGVDERGNLSANVGNVQAVNTLDDWTRSGAIAHASTEEIGSTITNKNNLNRWRQTIASDIQGQQKLTKAFMQQGMTQEEAANAVNSSVQGLVNQYGIESKVNTGLLSLGLQEKNMKQSAYQFEQSRTDRQAELAAARANALEIAKIKSNKGAGSVLTPSFNGFANRIGSVGTVTVGEEDDVKIKHVFGSGTSSNGIQNRTMKNETVSGKIYDLSSGSYRPVNKSINVIEGTEIGSKNVWVREDNGELIMMNTNATPKINYINGNPHISVKRGDKQVNVPIAERTVKEYSYNVNAGQKGSAAEEGKLKSFFKLASPEEAIDQMGYSNAAYENMGQTRPRSVVNSKGSLDIDLDFVKKNLGDSAYKYFKDLNNLSLTERDYTEEEMDNIEMLQNYDTRKSLWDSKVYPKYLNQGKLKNIAITDED